MSTLAEIEAAADALSPEQKQELMLFLAARLRANGAKMPEPRVFSSDEIANWIARDEADLARFKANTSASSRAIQFAISSEEKTRGSGIFFRRNRKLDRP